MHRDDDRPVIEPVRKRGLVALLKSMKPISERFPEIDDPPPAPERSPSRLHANAGGTRPGRVCDALWLRSLP